MMEVAEAAQHAVALCLERADAPYEGFPNYFAWLNAEYVRKRDLLTAGLVAAGLRPIAPEGGFFIIADTSNADSLPIFFYLDRLSLLQL